MQRTISRRAKIRLISFGIAVFAALAISSALWYLRSQSYRRQLEYTYMRSLQELSGYVTSISNTLGKNVYATSPQQMSLLSSQLWREAGSAKAALSCLPISELDLSGTYKFLSQVGNYSMSLSSKVANGGALSDEERSNIQALVAHSKSLTEQINALEQRISGGDLNLDEITKAALRYQNGAESPQGGDSQPDPELLSFKEMEDSFKSYPTLIYDGPFSDHLLEVEPRLLEGAASISVEQAQRRAAAAAGIADGAALAQGDEERSLMQSYTFEGEGISVGVTKLGGYVTYLTNSREIGSPTIDEQQAIRAAQEYLDRMGYSGMVHNYYETAANVCTINFAYTQAGVTYYTDLIKVGVALDNGEVVAYDARGYITNHTQRAAQQPTVSPEEAAGAVSDLLTGENRGLAVIPSQGMHEVLTYEFRCTNKDGQTVLVYVNAKTGLEEQILLLVETENGVLTV